MTQQALVDNCYTSKKFALPELKVMQATEDRLRSCALLVGVWEGI